jgi:peptidoglycan/LPS O-acetylase OafA/YrhL
MNSPAAPTHALPTRLTYFENLDGLRALAAFAVIFFHLSLHLAYPNTSILQIFRTLSSLRGQGGGIGVSFFFVLSGFLITYLMFSESVKNGRLQVRDFYLRRFLRIWPAYYLTLLVGFVVYPILATHTRAESANWVLYALFLTNFDNLQQGLPSSSILGVQWSVAVEEQFYLFWGVFFSVAWAWKGFLWMLIGLLCASVGFYAFQTNPDVQYFHSLSCLRYLVFGALLAYACFYQPEKVRRGLKNIGYWANLGLYVCYALFVWFGKTMQGGEYLGQFVPMLFFGYVIVEQNYSEVSFYKIGRFKLLAWLGKISYGLYLYHMIAIFLVLRIFPKNPDWVLLQWGLIVLLTVAMSHFSFHYIETYFLRLKHRFSHLPTQKNK